MSSTFPVTPTTGGNQPAAFQAAFTGSVDGFVTKLNANGDALLYSSYIGGSRSDFPLGLALDPAGNIYITGNTESQFTNDFPVSTGAFQTTSNNPGQTGFVAKFDPTKSGPASRIYATYLGGSAFDTGLAIAADAAGAAYVTGYTKSLDFPIKPGAIQATAPSFGEYFDAFVTKLNAAGDLVYSTYLGGSYDDYGTGIAADGAGNAYVAGYTSSISDLNVPNFPPGGAQFQPFPVTPSPLLSPTNAVRGQHGFLVKLNATGTAESYGTLLGGSNQEYAGGVALDGVGRVYVAGFTNSPDFPTTIDAAQQLLNGNGLNSGYYDAFLTTLDTTKSGAAALVYSTFLGGSSYEENRFLFIKPTPGLAVDAGGNAYVAGATSSDDFPVTTATNVSTAAYQKMKSNFVDAFVAKFAVCPITPGAWAATGNMPTARLMTHTATRLANGQVLIAGGRDQFNSFDPTNSAILYDPTTGTFSSTAPMAVPRGGHTATLLLNGKVLIAGGSTTGGVCLYSAELFDPSANSGAGAFSTLSATMNTSRDSNTATLLPDGRVLLTGGACSGAATAELFDPSANLGAGKFTGTASMADVRVGHTATLLPNGTVLVAGGANTFAGVSLSSAEIFDPANSGGTFSATGSLTNGRYGHRATLLPSGKVLVTGGADLPNINTVQTVEIFDPATGTFSTTTPMPTPVGLGHTATRLANGQVLIAGGADASTSVNFVNVAQLYDENSGQFIAVPNMSAVRYAHSATLLANGSVLVAGGEDLSAALSSAELYQPSICVPFNTPAGMNVGVTPVDTSTGKSPVSVTFSDVAKAGATTLTSNQFGPALPPNFELGNGVYYHIDTTATFTGDVSICIDYGGTSLVGTQPPLRHYDSLLGFWVPVANISYTPNPPNDTKVCGTVTSLSPFAFLIASKGK